MEQQTKTFADLAARAYAPRPSKGSLLAAAPTPTSMQSVVNQYYGLTAGTGVPGLVSTSGRGGAR